LVVHLGARELYESRPHRPMSAFDPIRDISDLRILAAQKPIGEDMTLVQGGACA